MLNFFILLSLLVFSSVSNSLARTVHSEDDSVIADVSGSFYALEPVTGEKQHRISRRHFHAISDNSRGNHFRLDLGPQLSALDMELSQDSAWSSDSIVVSRRGEQEEQLHNVIDSTCFLSGHLTSQNDSGSNGAVSISRCGRLYGMAQAGDFHYEIKSVAAEAEGDEEEMKDFDSSEFLNVVVTVRKVTIDDASADDTINIFRNKRSERDAEEYIYSAMDDGGKTKREIVLPPATAEVAVYLDANIIGWMADNREMKTAAALTEWLVMKWNIIRRVYANEREIGFPFTVQLKKIEFWWTNPSFYAVLGNYSTSSEYLGAFCEETAAFPNYDHKMLYTQGTGEHHLGLARLRGICLETDKCSLVKGKDDPVKIELHEFGHSLGLDHDPVLEPCTDPYGDGGFMGWGSNYRILDCYRRVLRYRAQLPESRCMYEVNVPALPVLNQNP